MSVSSSAASLSLENDENVISNNNTQLSSNTADIYSECSSSDNEENYIFTDSFHFDDNNLRKCKYFDLIKEGPTSICTRCGKLIFPRHSKKLIIKKLTEKYGEEFVGKIN